MSHLISLQNLLAADNAFAAETTDDDVSKSGDTEVFAGLAAKVRRNSVNPMASRLRKIESSVVLCSAYH